MFCPNCGTPCDDGAKMCPNCGNDLATPRTDPFAAAAAMNAFPKQDSSVVLILGIVATVVNSGLGCLCGCLGMFPGIVCAIVGLVLGIKEKKNYVFGMKNKKTEIGVILCIVALVLAVVISIANFVIGAAFADEILNQYNT